MSSLPSNLLRTTRREKLTFWISMSNWTMTAIFIPTCISNLRTLTNSYCHHHVTPVMLNVVSPTARPHVSYVSAQTSMFSQIVYLTCLTICVYEATVVKKLRRKSRELLMIISRRAQLLRLNPSILESLVFWSIIPAFQMLMLSLRVSSPSSTVPTLCVSAYPRSHLFVSAALLTYVIL